jgi:hypothetical protein
VPAQGPSHGVLHGHALLEAELGAGAQSQRHISVGRDARGRRLCHVHIQATGLMRNDPRDLKD